MDDFAVSSAIVFVLEVFCFLPRLPFPPMPHLTPARFTFTAASLLGAALLVVAHAPKAQAATLTWDPLNTANGATIDDGAGDWNTVNVWNNAGVNQTWIAGDTATFTGAVGGTVTGNASTSGVTVNGTQNYTFSGVISGAGGVTNNNSGMLTLTGANDYTGATTVSGGTLLMNGTHNAGAGTYGVGASGKLGGTGTITTTGAMAIDGQINGGDFGTVGTLSIAGAGSRVLAGTYLFDVDYGSAAGGDETGDLIKITGATSVAIAGGKFQLNKVGGATPAAGSHYAIKIFQSDIAVNGAPGGQSNYAGAAPGLASYQSIVTWDGGKSYYLVPEPASFALLALGSLLLLCRPSSRSNRRRR